nr:hypothetical protein GCM10020092_060650 [Actinoplanes digitatis]
MHHRQVVQGQAVRAQAGRHARQPVGDRGQAGRAGRHRDPAVTEADQVVAERPAAGLVVGQDRVDAERVLGR